MKIIYYHLAFANSIHSAVVMEYLKNDINAGHEVMLIGCKGNIICSYNLTGNRMSCEVCKYYCKKDLQKLPEGLIFKTIEDFLDECTMQESNSITFSYSSAKELRMIEYKGVKIGLSVLSSYIDKTRNKSPLIDEKTKLYFDKLLVSSVLCCDAVSKAVEDFKPDRVFVFNGRCHQNMPIVSLANKLGIDVNIGEVYGGTSGHKYKKYVFKNATPFSIDYNTSFVNNHWKDFPLSESEKIDIGRSFFISRRNGIEAGDVVYIKNQKKNLLPVNLDKKKRNVVIFNSSDDEIYSVGGDWDNSLFEDQITGVKSIVSELINDSHFHFFLRIHPNLKNVNYKYHTDLCNLNYPNLTIIEANSEVSTYALIDIADKVIVFNSTTGVEANFWGKPTILAGQAFYSKLNVAYKPKTLSDLISLIRSDIEPKNNYDSIKYGFFINTEKGYDFECFDPNIKRSFLGVKYNYRERSFVHILIRYFLLFIFSIDVFLKIEKNIIPFLEENN